jgi:hypothetical protein
VRPEGLCKNSITYSECVSVALVISHGKRIPLFIFSSEACLAIPYILTSSHKRRDFRKKIVLNTIFFFKFSLQFLSEAFLILKTFSEISQTYVGNHVKYPLFLSDFNDTLIFPTNG